MGSNDSKPDLFPTEVETCSDRWDDKKWEKFGFQLNKPIFLSKTTTYKKPDGWTIVNKKKGGGYFVDKEGNPRIYITKDMQTVFLSKRSTEELRNGWKDRNSFQT